MNPAWQLLRLASPQLPIGGYSYSQGLELAIDRGLVHDAGSARRWLEDQLLLNLGRFEAPLLLAHCQAAAEEDWARLASLAAEHLASRETRELAQESRQMGYSLKQLLDGLPELDASARDFLAALPEPGLAPAWALAARAWQITPADALAAWLWGLAGKPAGRADEEPATGPAGRPAPDLRAAAHVAAGTTAGQPASHRTLGQRRVWPGPGEHGA